MKKKYLNKIVDFLERKKVIQVEYKCAYLYGLELSLEKLIHIIIISFIAFLYRQLPAGIVFIILYSKLRKFAGGYHAKTSKGCIFFTIFIVNFVMIMVGIWSLPFTIDIIIIILVCIIIYKVAPIDCKNKPIKQSDIYKIKKKLFYTENLIIALYIISDKINCEYIKIIPVTLLTQLMVLIIGLKGSPIYFKETKEGEGT